MSDLYAVIGNPVAHSKSPQIHASFARFAGEDLRYERVLAPLNGFVPTVQAFRAGGGRGLNVTLPFKEEAYALAERHSDRALAAQAVNTLRFDDDGIYGDNTDGAGLVRDIVVNHRHALKRRRILIMGAGGAARGVIAPLLAENPAYLAVVNRNTDKAKALALRFSVDAFAYEELGGLHFDVVINATSASLSDAVPPLPAATVAGAFAYDMMYGEGDTPFLAFARQYGAQDYADGLGMLVEQAGESYFVWRGIRPDTARVLDEMRKR